MKSRRQRTNDDDPLAQAIAPPANESQHQRELRMRAEQEAQRISDAIDEELNRQRTADKKSPKAIKILLLGPSVHTILAVVLLIHPPRRTQAKVNPVSVPPLSPPAMRSPPCALRQVDDAEK